MKKKPSRFLLGAVSFLCVLFLAACNSAPVLQNVSVSPMSASLNMGSTLPLTCLSYWSDGSIKDVTTTAGWTSANAAVATVDSTGVVTGVTDGTSAVTCTYGGYSATSTYTVNPPLSITVTPDPSEIPVGLTQQLTATATFADESQADITASITVWSVIDSEALRRGAGKASKASKASRTATAKPHAAVKRLNEPVNESSVATIDATGVVTGTATGSTTAYAEYINETTGVDVTGSAGVNIQEAIAIGLQITPSTASATVGGTVDFVPLRLFSDGSTAPVQTPVTWASSSPTVATVLAQAAGDGIATAISSGSTTLTATESGSNCIIWPYPTDPEAPTTQVCTGTATLTVAPAVARFGYVPNVFDLSISGYITGAEAASITPIGKTAAGNSPQQAIVHTSGKFVYAIPQLSGGHVLIFTTDTTKGTLTAAGQSAGAVSTGGFTKGTIDPTGRFLYIVDQDSNHLFGFSIDQTTGGLTALSGSPWTTGAAPADVLVNPSGNFVYTVNTDDNNVSLYNVNAATGVLSSVANYATGNAPYWSAFSPTGGVLYVPNQGDSSVSAFTVAGAADPVPGALAIIGEGATLVGSESSIINQVVVDPSGAHVYAVDSQVSGGGNVYGYAINSDGSVGTSVTGSPFAVGNNASGLVIDPQGVYALVANNFDNTLSPFGVDSSSGTFTSKSLVETGAAPQFPTFANGATTASSTPSSLVATNSSSGNVSLFAVAGSGALTEGPNSPFAGAAGNAAVGTTSYGNLAFNSSASAMQLLGASIDLTADPAYAPFAGPVTLPGAAGSIVVSSTGKYVYVADTENSVVHAYWYNSGTNALVAVNSVAVAGGASALVADPQTSLIYALGNGKITPLATAAVDGSITLAVGGAQTYSGNWSAGSISPSGRFLVALDGGTNQLQVFLISPMGTGSDGALTAVTGSSIAIPGAASPSSIAVSPQGGFVAVGDAEANTVTTFTIDSQGILTAGSTATLPYGAGQLAFDPTGAYLFVGVYGDPSAETPVPGSVAVFTVDGTTLTAVSGSPFSTAGGTGTWGVGVINSIQ